MVVIATKRAIGHSTYRENARLLRSPTYVECVGGKHRKSIRSPTLGLGWFSNVTLRQILQRAPCVFSLDLIFVPNNSDTTARKPRSTEGGGATMTQPYARNDMSSRGSANVDEIMPKITATVAERSKPQTSNIDLSTAENWLIRPEVIEICKVAIAENLCPEVISTPTYGIVQLSAQNLPS